jgi:4a-hydroxytetrahydrobiopterin dehydratase
VRLRRRSGEPVLEAKEALSEAEIKKRLADLPQWKRNGKSLQRVVDFQEYLEGIDFVNIIAEIAEELNHHPDIEIRYTRVSVNCSTHRCKGITNRDFELAHRIEQLIEETLTE